MRGGDHGQYLGNWFTTVLFVIVYGVFVTLLYLIGLAGLWYHSP